MANRIETHPPSRLFSRWLIPVGLTQVGATILPLFAGITLIYLAFLKPGIWGIDGNDMLSVSKSLVLRGDFTVPPGTGGILGPDGQYYSARYPLLPIVAVPFVAIGLLLGNVLNLPTHYTAAACGIFLSALLTAGTAGFVVLLTLRLGGTRAGAYLAAVGFAFGTTALVYAREFFAEPLLSLLTTVALYMALCSKPSRIPLGTSLLSALVVTAKPSGIVVGPALSLYFLVKREAWPKVIAPSLGTCLGAMLYMSYNAMRFGSFFSSGQNTSRFGAEGFLGRFVGLLVSPGAGGGLFWYCPPTLLAIVGLWMLWRRQKTEGVAIAGLFAGFLILHSFWEFGGWNWGPRFLVPVLPSLMALAGLTGRRWRGFLIGLIILGFLVNAPTLVAFYQRYYAEAADAGQIRQALALWGDPSNAPIFNVWGATLRQLQDAFSTPVQDVFAQVGAPPPPGQFLTAELLRIVAVWWWFLPIAGIPLWVGVILASLLTFIGLFLLREGWKASVLTTTPTQLNASDSIHSISRDV
ncbi:hypothetical protein IQ241_05045 [Romeria aff. gracilis LEGE 07310]|uniref:Uncharacterized protein n=1 Tax=Vasconcelosia minhoensis LEGE 07310 TaxID=915328 RepID=A0A8J7AU43_9CYAN|nr:hypothetical protein [Romeria gracilis]MBE9076668.1 hypothetical protein [Romeria aff. gracilis LEGE 07310]